MTQIAGNVWLKLERKIEMASFSGQATLTTTSTIDDRDKAKFDFVKLVYPKKRGIQIIIIFLAPLMTEIEMASLVLTNKVDGAVTKLILISLNVTTYLNNVSKNISSMSVSIRVVDISYNCTFILEESIWVNLGGNLMNISECMFLKM